MFYSHPRLIAAFLLAASTAGCASLVDYQGNALPDDQIAALTVGATSREQVVQLLGSPTVTSMDKTSSPWLYISREIRSLAFLAPREHARRVVAIHFNENGAVKEIRRYTKKDGRRIALVSDETASPNQPPGFFARIFGNIGYVRPAGIPGQ